MCVFSFKRRQKLILKNCQWQDPAAFVFLPRAAVRGTASGHHGPPFKPMAPPRSSHLDLWGSLDAQQAPQAAPVVKNPPASAGDIRDAGSIPGSGRSPGGGHGKPLQYSCLENPTDRGAWRAIVHGAAKSQTRLSDTARVYMHARLLITRGACGPVEENIQEVLTSGHRTQC